MLERLKDKVPGVRVQAVNTLNRLQVIIMFELYFSSCTVSRDFVLIRANEIKIRFIDWFEFPWK